MVDQFYHQIIPDRNCCILLLFKYARHRLIVTQITNETGSNTQEEATTPEVIENIPEAQIQNEPEVTVIENIEPELEVKSNIDEVKVDLPEVAQLDPEPEVVQLVEPEVVQIVESAVDQHVEPEVDQLVETEVVRHIEPEVDQHVEPEVIEYKELSERKFLKRVKLVLENVPIPLLENEIEFIYQNSLVDSNRKNYNFKQQIGN